MQHAIGAALRPAHHEVIHASHERSATFGLLSTMRPEYAVLSGADFSEKLDESRALFAYLRTNHFLTCSSVPILDPLGNLGGVLDVTGDQRGYHQHTMAFVKMSGQMIENRLIASTFRDGLRIHFHSRQEFIGTLMEGIAVFDADGRLLSANRSAQFQLGLELGHLRSQTLVSLFGVGIDELMVRAGEPAHRFELRSGVKVVATIECQPPAHTSGARGRGARAGADDSPCRCVESRRTLHGRCPHAGHRRARAQGHRQEHSDPDRRRNRRGQGNARARDPSQFAAPRGAVRRSQLRVAAGTLIESELFGYAQGAFTGASKRGATGRIAQANGGTLFLDEIGDMPLALQSRLLRVLQEREVELLGAARAVPVDFTLICASNRKLRDMVATGAFREDLYYRVNGLTVTLPPLRERSDLRAVVMRILRTECVCHRSTTMTTASACRICRTIFWMSWRKRTARRCTPKAHRPRPCRTQMPVSPTSRRASSRWR